MDISNSLKSMSKYYMQIFLAIICVLITISIIFIYIGIDSLKTEYDIGEGLRKQYAPFFMEKERGEHRAYTQYMQHSHNNFQIARILIVVCVLIIAFAYIIYIGYYIVKADRYKGILLTILDDDNGYLKLRLAHAVFILVLLAMFVMIIVKTEKSYSKMCDHSEIHEKQTLINLRNFIISLLVIIVLAITPLYVSFNNDNMQNISVLILTIVIILLLLIYLIHLQIDFREKIKENYKTYKGTLCDKIKVSPALENEIEKNMSKEVDELVPCSPDDCDCGTYKESYKYLMHIINNYDITSISIPQQLKFMFKPIYLGGENSIHLKRALVNMYNSVDNESIVSHISSDDFSKYLTDDVRCIINEGCGEEDPDKDTLKTKYANLFRNHVINNTIFNKGDPLPNDLRKKMMQERQSSIMKDTIFKYYNMIYYPFLLIILIVSYLIYHFVIYKGDDNNFQIIAICVFVLLVMASTINWFSRLSSI